MKKTRLLQAALLVVILTGCSGEDVPGTDISGETELKVTANIEGNDISTRSVVERFSSSDIGVYVDDDAGVYGPAENSTASVTTGSSDLVAPSPSIYINADATVYAFYPASTLSNPVSTSPLAIAVVSSDDFEATDQDDYLWATPVNVSKSDRTVGLTFQHALSKVIFSITLGNNYAGSGNLTGITLTAANSSYEFLAGNGEMAIANGAVSGLTSTATLEYHGNLALSTSATAAEALVAPVILAESTSSASEITIALTLDGSTYSTTLPVSLVSEWVAATVYTYNITVNSGELMIGSVSITPWIDGSSTDITVS